MVVFLRSLLFSAPKSSGACLRETWRYSFRQGFSHQCQIQNPIERARDHFACARHPPSLCFQCKKLAQQAEDGFVCSCPIVANAVVFSMQAGSEDTPEGPGPLAARWVLPIVGPVSRTAKEPDRFRMDGEAGRSSGTTSAILQWIGSQAACFTDTALADS